MAAQKPNRVQIVHSPMDAHYAAKIGDLLVKRASQSRYAVDFSVDVTQIEKAIFDLRGLTENLNLLMVVLASRESMPYATEYQELQTSAETVLEDQNIVLIPLDGEIPLRGFKADYLLVRPPDNRTVTDIEDPFLQTAADAIYNRLLEFFESGREEGPDGLGLFSSFTSVFEEAGVTPSLALLAALETAASDYAERDEGTGEILISTSSLLQALFQQGLGVVDAPHVSWLLHRYQKYTDA